MPGWGQNSWGYHGDNGGIFDQDGTGKPYAHELYGPGDTIGCGIEFRESFGEGSIYYTKNGVRLRK